jgi:uncharacterized protein YciI
MYLIILTYKTTIANVDFYLTEHKSFLQRHYDSKHFIFSGARNPRIGGVILCKASSVEEVKQIISEDPFYINQIADYEIIEFTPTMFVDGFDSYF